MTKKNSDNFDFMQPGFNCELALLKSEIKDVLEAVTGIASVKSTTSVSGYHLVNYSKPESVIFLFGVTTSSWTHIFSPNHLYFVPGVDWSNELSEKLDGDYYSFYCDRTAYYISYAFGSKGKLTEHFQVSEGPADSGSLDFDYVYKLPSENVYEQMSFAYKGPLVSELVWEQEKMEENQVLASIRQIVGGRLSTQGARILPVEHVLEKVPDQDSDAVGSDSQDLIKIEMQRDDDFTQQYVFQKGTEIEVVVLNDWYQGSS